MTDHFFKELTTELHLAITEKEHPFRFGILATVGSDRLPRQRTIVLRQVSPNLHLGFYTDKRSKKVAHISENNKVSLLFYHPTKYLQINIEGLAVLQKDSELLSSYWEQTPKTSRKDYTTKMAPGSTVSNPDSVEYLGAEHHFCAVNVLPYKIEYLRLERPGAIRAQYVRQGAGWKGQFLVP